MASRIGKGRTRRRTFIREWRIFRGLSQEKLAGRLGTTAASISRLEKGEQPYSQEILEGIAEALICEPQDLLMRKPDQDAMWTIWERAKPAERGTIVDLAEALLKRRSQ